MSRMKPPPYRKSKPIMIDVFHFRMATRRTIVAIYRRISAEANRRAAEVSADHIRSVARMMPGRPVTMITVIPHDNTIFLLIS
jgi:hypothetical protein